MTYLKSILAGLLAAVAAAVLWILAVFAVPLIVPFLISRVTNTGGVGAAYIDSGSIFAAALVGFFVGFYWQFRRLSRRRLHAR